MAVSKEPNGTWMFVVDLPTTGKRRQCKRRGFRTKREAQDVETALLAEAQQGIVPGRGKLTLDSHLDRWLACVMPRLADRTWQSYGEVCRLHVSPCLGKCEVSKLSPLHVEKLLAECRGRGLSEIRTRYVYRVLSMALKQAVLWRLVSRNACEAVRAPRIEEKEGRCLSREQALSLLDHCRGGSLYVPALLALTCGLRLGEVCALRWSAVDLDGGFLTVRETAQKLPGSPPLKPPKNRRSQGVALPAGVVDELRLAKALSSEEFVCGENGAMLRPLQLQNRFRRLAEKLGLDISFHGLRHTQGTLLLAAGVHPRIAMERMRHSSLEMTRRYQHLLDGMAEDAAGRVDLLGDP